MGERQRKRERESCHGNKGITKFGKELAAAQESCGFGEV